MGSATLLPCRVLPVVSTFSARERCTIPLRESSSYTYGGGPQFGVRFAVRFAVGPPAAGLPPDSAYFGLPPDSACFGLPNSACFGCVRGSLLLLGPLPQTSFKLLHSAPSPGPA